MARFDEIYEKYKKKQQNGTGFSGAVTSASGTGTVAAEKNEPYGGYKATGRFAGILANYQKNGASFSGVDDSYVQSFFKDAQAYTQKAAEESKNMGWAMATDKAKNEERNRALTDLGNRAKAVKVYLTSNKKSIDPKAYEEYMRFLKNFENDKQSIYDTFLGNTNYYSQWDTQEEYDFHEAHSTPEKRREWYAGLEKRKKELEAQKEQEAAAWQETEANANSYDGFEYSEMEEAHWNKLKAIEEEINKIGTEMRQYERGGYNEKGQHYGSKQADDALALTMEKDFATLSQQRDHKNPTRQQLDEADSMNNSVNWDYDEMGVLRDAYGNAITTDETGKRVSTKAQEYAVKDKLGVYLSATDKEKEEYMGTIVNGTWGEIIGEGMEGSWDQLNDNEIGVYYYLLNKDGVAAAEKFLKEMTPELNRRAAEKARQAQLEMYNESGLGGKLLLNAATVPANLLGGITGLAQDAAHLIRGEETNPYSSAHSFNAFGNTIRSETAKELEELMPGVKIPLLNFTVGDLYQTIMSRADSLAAMGIGGSLGGVLLATNAAANEMTRLYEQGASVKQMAWGAAAVGAAELVFETLSIENLKSIKDAKKRFGRIKSALVQGEIEASEEGLTEIANIISNAVVMGSESDWNKLVEANGGDELTAFLEKVRDVAKASFGGFLSGAPAGALASPGKGSQQTTQQKQEASVQAQQRENAPTVEIDGVAWPTREDIERAEAGEKVQPKSEQPAAQTTTQPQQADKRLEWAKQDKEGLEAMIQKRQKADSIVVQRLNTEIDQLQAEYDGLKSKDTAKGKQLLAEIEGKKAGVERYAATGDEAVQKLQARLDKVNQEIEMLEWEPEAGEVAEAQQTTQKSEETPAQQTQDQEAENDEDIVGGRLAAKRKGLQWRLEQTQKLKEQYVQEKNEQIRIAQSLLDRKKDKTTKVAQKLKNRIVTLEAQRDAQTEEYDRKMDGIQKQIAKVEAQQKEDHTKENRVEKAIRQIEEERKAAELEATAKYYRERSALLRETEDRGEWIRKKAADMKWEMANWVKGESKASPLLKILFKEKFEWKDLYNALTDVKDDPLNFSKYPTDAEVAVRDLLDRAYEETKEELKALEDRHDQRMKEIAKEAEEKKRKNRQAYMRKESNVRRLLEVARIAGNIAGWSDKNFGWQYKVNTLRRNLRDVVRKADGAKDLATADALDAYLSGNLNHNEAELKREFAEKLEKYREMDITKAENVYIQMLGEYLQGGKDNAKTNVTKEMVDAFYEANRDSIDDEKCRKIVEMARKDFDEFFQRVNAVYRENGMEELKYVQGYFPHMKVPEQNWVQKLLNWQPKEKTEKPTAIAGKTGTTKPGQRYNKYRKTRKGPETDFNFMKGYEQYAAVALDVIYHTEDILRRRALENYIRITHAQEDEELAKRIESIQNSDVFNANEEQVMLEDAFQKLSNPLGKFVTDLMIGTNILAGKRSSGDRLMEEWTSADAEDVLKRIAGRNAANLVAGSVSAGFSNLISIPMSWARVGVGKSLKTFGTVLKNSIQGKDDGLVEKSDFMTNRLRNPEKLYKQTWDKIGDVVSWWPEYVDNLATQTIWRSKYEQNVAEGMSEDAAIKDADIFAEGVLAGRSRGNMPTAFESKNIVAKMLTTCQLEVANQYGYWLKDLPQDMQQEGFQKLTVAYMKMFAGVFVLNSALGFMTGRGPATDPIGMIAKLIQGLLDEDEEPEEAIKNFGEEILQQIPFIGGLLGGGRVPLSSAMPYDSIQGAVEGLTKDVASGDWKSILEEMTNPLYYLVSPMGGGQLRKTFQGSIGLYAGKEHPGSYTADGELRYTVGTDPLSVLQNVLFGRWSGQEAQQYLDEGRKPLTEKQTKEFFESGMTIQQYWDYRDDLGKLKKQDEKLALINGLDLSDEQKRVLKSYLFDEEGYAEDNPEKYAFLEEEGIGYLGWKELPDDEQQAWSWAFKHQDEYRHYKKNGVLPGDYTTYQVPMLEFKDEANQAYEWEYNYPDKAVMGDVFEGGVVEYRKYTKAMSEMKADKDKDGKDVAGSRKKKVTDYINGLDLDYGEKIILYVAEYNSKASRDAYGYEIVDYLNGRSDLELTQIYGILKSLGFKVSADGSVTWD